MEYDPEIRKEAQDPYNRTTAKLLRCGVPFDVAESWPEITRVAFCIIFGEQDGHRFDWDNMEWVK